MDEIPGWLAGMHSCDSYNVLLVLQLELLYNCTIDQGLIGK